MYFAISPTFVYLRASKTRKSANQRPVAFWLRDYSQKAYLLFNYSLSRALNHGFPTDFILGSIVNSCQFVHFESITDPCARTKPHHDVALPTAREAAGFYLKNPSPLLRRYQGMCLEFARPNLIPIKPEE
jgi:hypothetical protein